VENAHFVEQHDCDATSFAFADFCTKADEESFDVLPSDVRAGRV